jgi:tRNA A37 threonylcarbamoyladenosine modification protein TsaB
VPIIDAKRNLVYCSIYKRKGRILKRIAPYMLLTMDELFKKVKASSIILGDALSLYREVILRKIKGATLLDKDYWYPKAHNIIVLAQERIKEKKLDNPFDIKPIYLYPKECQIKNVKCKTKNVKLQRKTKNVLSS